MLRKLKLYGQLAEFVGHKEFEIKVNSVSQAVSFLIHNFPEVERFMCPKSVSYTHLTLPTKA